jgi:glycerophosphoryl diester phosphodiesterase
MFTNSLPTEPLVIGHRGASADFPENSVAAFHGAKEQGADWVELDVHLNSLGELVVHHDAKFRDGRSIWSTALSDAPSGIIDLATALDACSTMGINVEIKNSPGDSPDAPYTTAVADVVVALLGQRAEAGVTQEILISSFDLPTLDRVSSIAPDLALGYLVFDLTAGGDALAVAADRGHVAIHPWDPLIDADFVSRCNDLGVQCNVWTVDDPDRSAELASFGVNGIVTNTPLLTRQALSRSH